MALSPEIGELGSRLALAVVPLSEWWSLLPLTDEGLRSLGPSGGERAAPGAMPSETLGSHR